MHEKSCVMLRLLLNRYHGGEVETLLRGLPEEDSQKILNIPIESSDVQAVLEQPQDAIKNIHYSWLISPMQEIEKNKLPVVLSLLPEPHSSKLRKALNETSAPLELTPSAKSFLMTQLYHSFKFNEVLPVEYLPVTDMTPLVHLHKNELIEIIDFLGIYDLAEEIHHIVNKKLLEEIYTCLTRKKQKFLRNCLHQKEKLVTQRLELEHWDGDCTKLSKILHHKGMVRLGYAISGQHKDLIWHITHILDTGRGEKLARYCSKDPISGVTDTLKKQVKEVITFFKQASKK